MGLLHLDFSIYGVHSLKEKRRIVKSIVAQIRSKFNCSVAETDFHDLWQRARITICVVANEHRFANTQLNEIAKFAFTHADAEILDYRIEML
ncbi:MAG: DUF503 domain-containing protein [Candidatus Hydrogenedentes bacterium]|nr:DUF503 domain-containing protein [Candidatus Hydrogenedentota bacterium]